MMDYWKLIELLNESAVLDTIFEDEYQVKFRITKIISKELGFIKWLVDNDKIDLVRLSCTAIRYTEIIDADFSREDRILMILAIQDNPIEFLISILK